MDVSFCIEFLAYNKNVTINNFEILYFVKLCPILDGSGLTDIFKDIKKSFGYQCLDEKDYLILRVSYGNASLKYSTDWPCPYSLVQNVFSSCCIMNRKCQLQMGLEQYENTATPLRTKSINTTHHHFPMRYITLF